MAVTDVVECIRTERSTKTGHAGTRTTTMIVIVMTPYGTYPTSLMSRNMQP